MKCQIQWVDPLSGIETPDDNDAVAIIYCDFNGGTPSPSYACCAEHLRRMPVGRTFARNDTNWVSEWKVVKWLKEDL